MSAERLERETLSALLSLLAHDMRNPLAAMVTNLDFARAATEGDVADAIDEAALACRVVDRLVGNLGVLAVALSDTAPRPRARPLSLAEAIAASAARLRGQALASSLAVEIALAADGLLVLAQPDLLARALDNLLSNALQHAPPGGTITIEAGGDGAAAHLHVLDDGPAIPREERAAAASAAGQVRLKTSTSGRYGRGLGLWCAAILAERLDGELILGEREGRSCLSLRLPLARS
jgi:signal transduction histidine kinase